MIELYILNGEHCQTHFAFKYDELLTSRNGLPQIKFALFKAIGGDLSPITLKLTATLTPCPDYGVAILHAFHIDDYDSTANYVARFYHGNNENHFKEELLDFSKAKIIF